jgi:hypothetical protein
MLEYYISKQLTFDEYSILNNIKKEHNSITPYMLYYLLIDKKLNYYILNKILDIFRNNESFYQYQTVIFLLYIKNLNS